MTPDAVRWAAALACLDQRAAAARDATDNLLEHVRGLLAGGMPPALVAETVAMSVKEADQGKVGVGLGYVLVRLAQAEPGGAS